MVGAPQPDPAPWSAEHAHSPAGAVQTDPFSRLDQTPIFRPTATFHKVTATLYHAYRRAPGWRVIEALCDRITANASRWTSLAACNIDLTLWLASALGLQTPVHRWSDHPLTPAPDSSTDWRSERIARYARLFQCTHFLFGQGTASYLDPLPFQRRGIALVSDQWIARPYDQTSAAFIPNLSIVDLLAQRPDDAAEYLEVSP